MNKRVLAVVVALVLLIGGSVIAYATIRPAAQDAAVPAPVVSAPVTPSTTPVPATPEQPAAVTPGVYTEYSDTAIADAAGRTVLFFHAPWCGQCRDLESDILSEGVPDGVTIIKVDYDSHQDLRQKYGVTMRTTFVEIDASGSVSQSFVAYDTPQLTAVIDALSL